VVDHFNAHATDDGSHTLIVAQDVHPAASRAVLPRSSYEPVLFRGVAQFHEEPENPLLMPLLSASWDAISAENRGNSGLSPNIWI
jgi:oligosaccharyltransferase complex subunit beta